MTVATFTDANPSATAGDFTATIDWGDGHTTTGTVTEKNGVFSVAGSNTYAVDGSDKITVTITDKGGSTTTATSTATVADAALTANGSPVSATEGSSTGTVTVATFTDANPSATAGDFTATINWGDGTSSSGTITEDPNTKIFSVNGAAHTYTEEGHYTITATIADVGGSTTTATSTATVADAALTASGSPVSATEGSSTGTVTVATFTDANPSATAGDFTATINWGDGHTSTGTVTEKNGGGFSVAGTNTYAEDGKDTITATGHRRWRQHGDRDQHGDGG